MYVVAMATVEVKVLAGTVLFSVAVGADARDQIAVRLDFLLVISIATYATYGPAIK